MPVTEDRDTTDDRLLDGRVRLTQPRKGYRVAIDAPLLAAAVAVAPGLRVVDLGCGVGAVLACLGARVADLDLVGVERDPWLADLARRNLAAAGHRAEILVAAIEATRPAAHARGHHVVINPPFRAPGQTRPADPRAAAADHEEQPFATWIATARRWLLPGGRVTVIWPADRLRMGLAALDGFGAVQVLPVRPKAGAPAKRVILAATLGARGPDRLLPELVLHDAEGHFTREADAVLRHAGTIPIGPGEA